MYFVLKLPSLFSSAINISFLVLSNFPPQIERDMSALYVSAINPETKELLVTTYPETDKALEGLSRWPQVREGKRVNFILSNFKELGIL